MEQAIEKTVSIKAPADKVWDALTKPELMQQWMSETAIDIVTDWEVGKPFIIRGDWYKTGFENKGVVLAFEQDRVLSYSHLSSLSRLVDSVENYVVLRFRLTPVEEQISVSLSLTNFPTEIIYKHLAFYWGVALELLRKFVEDLMPNIA